MAAREERSEEAMQEHGTIELALACQERTGHKKFILTPKISYVVKTDGDEK